MLQALLKWSLKNTAREIIRNFLTIFSPILRLFLHITLLIVVLTWLAIHYPIKVSYILGVFKINCLIPTTDAELMVRHRRTMEVHDSLCIRAFSKDNLFLMQYMLITRWLHLLYGLGHYVILPGTIAHILMMTNNIMTLVYIYAKCRLKNPPDIFFQIAHISRLLAWIPSILSWTPAPRGRDRSLLRPGFPKAFTVTKNQEGPTIFDTSTWYTLWYLVCTHSANPYFDLCTEYKPLVK